MRVRSGNWHPDDLETDRGHRYDIAARAIGSPSMLRSSVQAVLEGGNPSKVADSNHGSWYLDLFAPSVTAGLLAPVDPAGYRRGQVYIRGSMQVTVKREAVALYMEPLLELRSSEKPAPARAVLGHFFFVFIHLCMDRQVPDESRARIRRISPDRNPSRSENRLPANVGRSQRPTEHQAIREVPSRTSCASRWEATNIQAKQKATPSLPEFLSAGPPQAPDLQRLPFRL
ncbi:hypothetical protein VDG1235_4646 [Verrucomicrobiia bacterium DG1235]|nr:hypothetical protein VDG1235_4646 [Verrucomicrobiae bacterium DG1235]